AVRARGRAGGAARAGGGDGGVAHVERQHVGRGRPGRRAAAARDEPGRLALEAAAAVYGRGRAGAGLADGARGRNPGAAGMSHATRRTPGASVERERLAAPVARVGYVAVILLATLSRLQPEFNGTAILQRLGRALDPSLGARDAVDAVRNVVLFAGWGAVWLVTAGGAAGRAIRGATATGAALSLLVEAAQLTSPVRTASPLDLLTNTLGAFAGAVFTAGLGRSLERSIGRRSFVGMPAYVFAGSYLCVLLAESVAPLFGGDPLPDAKGGPLSRFATSLDALAPGTLFELPVQDVLLYFPAGVFCVLALIEAGLPSARAARWTAAAGALVAAAGEVGHAALGYPIGLGTVVVHGTGIGLGAWAARRWVGPLSQRLRGRARPRAL